MTNELTPINPPETYQLSDPARQAALCRLRDKALAEGRVTLGDEYLALKLITQEALESKSPTVAIKSIRAINEILQHIEMARIASSETLARPALQDCGETVVEIARDVIFSLPIDEDTKVEAVEELGLRIFAAISNATNTKEAVRKIAESRGLNYGPNDDTLDRIFPE